MRPVSGSRPVPQAIISSCSIIWRRAWSRFGSGTSRWRVTVTTIASPSSMNQLGRLLDDLQDQGLLHNTLVIITSDHGEGFGDHRTFGHAESLYLDAIGVPLVILSAGRARGPRCDFDPAWPARPAGDRGRPTSSLGRLTVPRPAAGGLLGLAAPDSHPRRSPQPSRNSPAPSRPDLMRAA